MVNHSSYLLSLISLRTLWLQEEKIYLQNSLREQAQIFCTYGSIYPCLCVKCIKAMARQKKCLCKCRASTSIFTAPTKVVGARV